jgi:hypothetical protein
MSEQTERAWLEGLRYEDRFPRARLCDHFIDGGADPWAGTYCKRPAGHDGDHSAHYPPSSLDAAVEVDR